MTIVATETLTAQFIYIGIIVAIAAVVLAVITVMFIYESFSGAFFDGGVLLAALATLALTVFCVVAAFKMGSEGPETHVHAIVDDWNAVHDAGYEVIDQQGDLVTLRKAQP